MVVMIPLSTYVHAASRSLRVFSRIWFRFSLRGAERVPQGPCLFVGNHSGIGIAETVCLMGERTKIFRGRNVVGMTHDLFIGAPLIGPFCAAMGAVRANPKAARDAIAGGSDVLVYPGGSLDSCRPMHLSREVVFGTRRGYVRLALETGVPIVPLATIGSHATYLLLPWIGDAIGGWLRRRGRSRDARLPVPIALVALVGAVVAVAVGACPAWVIAAALAVLVVPNPARITTEVLPPIDVCAATAHIADVGERLEVAHRIVHSALARRVATMRHSESSSALLVVDDQLSPIDIAPEVVPVAQGQMVRHRS
jgi:1-acyl-sn-glycerol-3-phosphate acyltransferase